MLEWLESLASPWSALYGESVAVQTVVLFLHLGGLLVAGGVAFTNDRSVLRAAGSPARQPHVLAELSAAHGLVVGALAVVIVSGVAMLLSEVDEFIGSWVFWAKMVAIVLLLVNGRMLQRAERVVESDPAAPWTPLRGAALRSMALWLAVLALGTLLPAMA